MPPRPLAQRRGSLVAGVNALFRSREGRARAPVLDDGYAHLFGERHPYIWALRVLRLLIPPLRRLVDELQVAHCVRHRAIDELCGQAAREGFDQIVLVGAGYDSRPQRLRTPQVRWFEVDHAATAARKQRILRRAGLRWNAAPVAADLARDNLLGALAVAGFDPAAPTCFVLEGLAHYLDRATFTRLLAAAAAGPGRRRLILSYIDRAMGARPPSLFVGLVRLLREVPTGHFDRDELAALARAAGLALTAHLTFAEQVTQLTLHPAPPTPRLSQHLAVFEG